MSLIKCLYIEKTLHAHLLSVERCLQHVTGFCCDALGSWQTHLAPLVHFGVDAVLGLVGAGACAEGEEAGDHLSRQTMCELLRDVECLACRTWYVTTVKMDQVQKDSLVRLH